MSSFQPPPTWALPILVDEKSGKAIFNPIWLKWFVDLSANLSSTGTPTGYVRNSGGATVGNFVTWANSLGTQVADGGVVGSAAHQPTSAFLAAGATAQKAYQAATGFKASDGTTGYSGTLTPASFVGKTMTIVDGVITTIV